jgi:hypothetical protein
LRKEKCLHWVQTPKANDCRAIIKEIEALPKRERECLVQRMRELGSGEIPQDFIDALENFEKERFVSIETAFTKRPRARELSIPRRREILVRFLPGASIAKKHELGGLGRPSKTIPSILCSVPTKSMSSRQKRGIRFAAP